MANSRYSDELKQHILREVSLGTPVAQLARDYDPSAATIHLWVRASRSIETDASPRSERERALEKQVLQLQRQVAFLKKAASWFARECETVPGGMPRTD